MSDPIPADDTAAREQLNEQRADQRFRNFMRADRGLSHLTLKEMIEAGIVRDDKEFQRFQNNPALYLRNLGKRHKKTAQRNLFRMAEQRGAELELRDARAH